MARFEYLEARPLRQAISLCQRHGDQARLVAGSTDFLVRWRLGSWRPQYVINIQRIASLGRVSYSARNGLRLGALVTVETLQNHPVIRQRYPALAAAAGAMVFMVFLELLPESCESASRSSVGLLVSLTLGAMILFQGFL